MSGSAWYKHQMYGVSENTIKKTLGYSSRRSADNGVVRQCIIPHPINRMIIYYYYVTHFTVFCWHTIIESNVKCQISSVDQVITQKYQVSSQSLTAKCESLYLKGAAVSHQHYSSTEHSTLHSSRHKRI